MKSTNTICAIATPAGHGAISVIRVSGTDAIIVGDKIFSSINKGKKLKTQKSGTLHFGMIVDDNEIVDEVIISVYKSPNSYTGEDAIEISCHGSVYIQQRVLQLLLKNDIKLALPGEFTQRAFLNGKMDLSQAEAVADLIASSSAASHKIAINQIRGGFSEELNLLRDKLIEFISLIELELDFSEEDVEFADRNRLQELLSNIKLKIKKLIFSFKLGNVIKNGVPVAIIGEPNVGKSTLLNALFNEEKAIVSEIAGTTRDAIEDVLNIEGVLFRFIDTAGLRKTTDIIESLGIEKTAQKIKQADLILLMVEATNNWQHISNQIKYTIDDYNIDDQQLIVLINKIDKNPIEASSIEGLQASFPKISFIQASAKNKTNIEELTSILKKTYDIHSIGENDIIVSNLRHYEALQQAFEALGRVEEGIKNEITGDFLAMDIRQVLHYIGEITGQISTDDILGNIFKNFCIGK
ncbi:MAG: tRNA uridine-5-carboxymethylaminomethyl(34) synthesis GTPase MnmE [Bacteroidales bacterium]|nr:tRNA uridine-5-carboxymethylaminomethyl(34) synthesis GTPase MnmE [Bacteroidales bacterium]